MEALIVITDIVEKLILITLICLSIWSVSIMVERRRVLKSQGLEDFESVRQNLQDQKWEALKQWTQSQKSFLAGSLKAALQSPQNAMGVEKAVHSYVKSERMQLEKGLAVLATLGANAPFIGLFGTVLGIIRAFAYLGSQSGSAAVMSGVSQALYATAVGLFVAIPAVVAFNIFSKKLKDLVNAADSLKDLYISKISE